MRNNKKGFTLIELLIVVVIVGILALAAIPLISANTRDARMAEGRQLLGTMRNQARVEFSKTNSPPATLLASGVTANQRTGQYYTVGDAITTAGTSPAWTGEITATANGTSSDPAIDLTFGWEDGSSVFDPA